MKCENCNGENRDIAKYCKWCGKAILDKSTRALESIVGMGEVKEEMRKIVKTMNFMKKRQGAGGKQMRIGMHTLIIGNTGTGKTMIANVLQQLFFANGIISKPTPKIVDAVDYKAFAEEWDDNIEDAKGGILFFDNVQKLLPDSYSTEINELDKLFHSLDNWDNDPIVILSGLPEGFGEFLAANPNIKNRFHYQFNLPVFTQEQLYKVCSHKLADNYQLKLSDEAANKLERLCKYVIKTRDESFGNGHFATETAESIFKAYLNRVGQSGNDNSIVQPEDITAEVPEEKSLEQVIAEMDEFVGMDEVKETVRDIATQVQAFQERAKRGLGSEKPAMHFVLTGNPGTGKTTVARKLGEIFEAVGFLDSGHVVEVDRSQMVGQYKGETPKLVNDLCDKAMNGILFVDEAYTLAPVSSSGNADQYGKEAIETLMKRMEDDRDKFVVISAGYKLQMDNFLRTNPGLKSRFNRFLHIEDYKPQELEQIFRMFLKKKNYVLDPAAEEKLSKAVADIYEARDKNFGNGREMRKLYEATSSRFSERISKILPQELTDADYYTIKAEDIPYEEEEVLKPEDVMQELNQLSGLDNVKQEVESLVKFLNLEQERSRAGGQKTPVNMHFVFTGNPGTGKTTVARIMANVFKALRILPKGHLVEADRSQMVAAYTGQTAIKVNQLVDSAMGGVLFIDEAYSLVSGEHDSFGKEAIDTLLKRLEDDRGKFICIAAGYTNEMEEFLDSNPGLKSRFNRTIEFQDYKPEALTGIFLRMAEGKGFSLDEETKAWLPGFFEGVYMSRDKNFGNAREVRKIFDQALSRQSNRLAEIHGTEAFSQEMLSQLTRADIEGEEAKTKSLEDIMAEMDEFIGMNEVKQTVREIANRVLFNKQRQERGLAGAESIGLNIVLTGNPGTGKTTVARKLGEIFKAIGFLPNDKVIEVDRSQMVGQYLGETPKLVNKLCDRAMGGILFVDEAYTLTPQKEGGGKDQFGQEAVETLMKRLEDDRGKFVVIAAGYHKEMEDFLDANPGMKSRFNEYIHINDYAPNELLEIFKLFARKKSFHLPQETEERLEQAIQEIHGAKNKDFGNAREMRKLFEEASTRMSTRLSNMPQEELTDEAYSTLLPEDIPVEAREAKSLEDIMAEMDEFIGMNEVKQAVRQIANQVKFTRQRQERGFGSGEMAGFNLVLTGNPGTGKTTVARKLGEIFKAIGFLPNDKVVEADRSQMVGQYLGETPKLVNKLCDKAMGGILFVDEAYTLTPQKESGGKDQFGQEAVETLMKRMEDDRGKFVVIAAGYRQEMDNFLRANPGIKSRFNEYIHIEDYKPGELLEIFKMFARKKSFQIPPETEETLAKAIRGIYEAKSKNFGNAREMRKLFEETSSAMSTRLSKIPAEELTNDAYTTIMPEDVPVEEAETLNADEVMKELNQLYGLDNVKQEVRSLVDYLNMEKERAQITGKKTAVNMHFIFSGNPGTGKTTVARIMARVFKSLGILPRGQLVEADRSQMVAGYLGQTAIKVNQLVDSAIGGVLFIDEAYSLVSSPNDSFGKEAIETLLKRLEDDRGKFICIAAGYTKEMEDFLEANPGMHSRFNRKIEFEDYNGEAMTKIFMKLVESNGFVLDEEARAAVPEFFEQLYANRNRNFGNAREVRKVLDRALTRQSERLASIFGTEAYDPSMLNVLQKSDIL